ncbi:MAG: inositol monophosphatase [Armatimonadetes bacterium]|nr:inositol monophosphatase [Armatimonadota bacterium]
MANFTAEKQFLLDVSREAGALLLSFFGHIKTWEIKSSRGDIVTEADRAAEDLVLTRLEAEFPGHNLLSEERGWVRHDEAAPIWVLDPLDGTRNFALGIPTFAVSLACLVNGRPVLGAIYDPVHDDMYLAQANCGAWLNENRLTVSDQPDLSEAMVSVSWSPRRKDKELYIRTVNRINAHTSWFRRIGSAAMVMAYLASGRWDAYVQGGINPWDIAAGVILITEAGGIVSDFQGEDVDILSDDINLLAANPAIHRQLVREIMAD